MAFSKDVLVVCKTCKETFSTKQWKLNQGKGLYCSKQCKFIGTRKEGILVDGLWFGKSGKNKYYWYKATNGTSRSLHKHTWEKFNGPVPCGFEVHHKDSNSANNSISNLEILESAEHSRMHLLKRISDGTLNNETNLLKAREAAKIWHKSIEGRAWHKGHAKKIIADRRSRGLHVGRTKRIQSDS